MSIRIYSKKAFGIGPGVYKDSNVIDEFVTVPMSFQDMPEKYASDPTFKRAVKSGDITIITGKVEQGRIEEQKPIVESEDDPVKEYYEKVKAMKKEEVKEACEQYGANFVESDKLSDNKKRLMEAYKLSLK